MYIIRVIYKNSLIIRKRKRGKKGKREGGREEKEGKGKKERKKKLDLWS